jgi:alpha-beta hydrolase superfamily lysophospholipase
MKPTGKNLSARSLPFEWGNEKMNYSISSSRRDFLGGAALALGAATTMARTWGEASPKGAPIHAYEYWAHRGDIRLYLYRKLVGPTAPGNSQRPILFLAHGSSVSSRPTFDLSVPGHGEYSVMDVFARYGYDVWTMDFEGYGHSSPSHGNSNIADGVADLQAATPVIWKETGQDSFFLYGESSGALRAASFAMDEPTRVGKLVLSAFTWTGKGSPTLEKRAKDDPYYRSHNTRVRDRKMILSIFTRDKPGTSDPAVGEAMANEELKFGDTAPTGTYLDMTTKLPLVDPEKLPMPVQILHGQFDGIATVQDLSNFFDRLPAPDRQLVIMPGAAHLLALGRNRAQFWHVMHGFLDMPSRQDLNAAAEKK